MQAFQPSLMLVSKARKSVNYGQKSFMKSAPGRRVVDADDVKLPGGVFRLDRQIRKRVREADPVTTSGFHPAKMIRVSI